MINNDNYFIYDLYATYSLKQLYGLKTHIKLTCNKFTYFTDIFNQKTLRV